MERISNAAMQVLQVSLNESSGNIDSVKTRRREPLSFQLATPYKGLEHSKTRADYAYYEELFREKLGVDYVIESVGENGSAGIILMRRGLNMQSYKDWVLFDIDDTILQYSDGWRERNERYLSILNEQGIRVTNEIMEETNLMQFTRDFSVGNRFMGKTYNQGTHLFVLSYIMMELQKEQSSFPLDLLPGEMHLRLRTKIHALMSELARIQSGEYYSSDPFTFNDDGDFALTNEFLESFESDKIVRERIGWIMKPMTNPLPNNAVLETVFSLEQDRSNKGSDYEVKVKRNLGVLPEKLDFGLGIFTVADPQTQLQRIFNMYRQYQDNNNTENIPFDMVWISTLSTKEEFIYELIKAEKFSRLIPQRFIQVNDNSRQLAGVIQANQRLEDETAASFVALRLKMPGSASYVLNFPRSLYKTGRLAQIQYKQDILASYIKKKIYKLLYKDAYGGERKFRLKAITAYAYDSQKDIYRCPTNGDLFKGAGEAGVLLKEEYGSYTIKFSDVVIHGIPPNYVEEV